MRQEYTGAGPMTLFPCCIHCTRSGFSRFLLSLINGRASFSFEVETCVKSHTRSKDKLALFLRTRPTTEIKVSLTVSLIIAIKQNIKQQNDNIFIDISISVCMTSSLSANLPISLGKEFLLLSLLPLAPYRRYIDNGELCRDYVR